MIERDYFKLCEKELKNKQITALVGLRQVGKTTILEYVYEKVKKDSIFLRFDNLDVLEKFENDIEFFIEEYVVGYKYIFIDEIQYSSNSGQKLKYIYDSFKDKKIFISGSSLPELAIHSLSYLVGRVNIFQIYPVSFKEFVRYKNSSKTFLFEKMRSFNQLGSLGVLFEEYLRFGGYPGVILRETPEDKRRELENLVNTYLLKEIREILNFNNVFDFEKTLRRIALSDGSFFNKSNVSSELDIERRNFSKIIDVLYSTAILYQVQPFLSNKIKELIKTPKVYLSDLGFKNSLIKNFNSLYLRQDKGSVYESFILQSLLSSGLVPQCWNLRNEFEVDFVLEGNGMIFGFEVKSSVKSDTITTSMKKFIDLYSPKELYVFNEKQESTRFVGETKVVFTSHLNIVTIIDSLREQL